MYYSSTLQFYKTAVLADNRTHTVIGHNLNGFKSESSDNIPHFSIVCKMGNLRSTQRL